MPYIKLLHTYPLKSAGSLNHDSIAAGQWGLSHDRNYALIDREGNCLTARTHPAILHLQPTIENDLICITYKSELIGTAPLTVAKETDSIKFKIFSYDAYGTVIQDVGMMEFISNLIGTQCQLIMTSRNQHRPVLSKHGGHATDTLAFADQAPILVVSTASLQDLNTRTPHKIKMQQFRPNIVVEGVSAGEEDIWKRIQIGSEVKLRLIQQCERCIFTTIDPITLQKDPKGEPLRTLSKYRLNQKKNTVFGMHAVVEKSGQIKVGDQITILE